MPTKIESFKTSYNLAGIEIANNPALSPSRINNPHINNSPEPEELELNNTPTTGHDENWWNSHYGTNYVEASKNARIITSIERSPAGFSETYNSCQETLNILQIAYEDAANNTNVTLSSSYNFVGSLDGYENSIIENADPEEEIFVYNTKTSKYEKTTVGQWVGYILNGACFDFSVLDPNAPIQLIDLEDGETAYKVDYTKLKEYYNKLNQEELGHVVDSSINQFDQMLSDYNNLYDLYSKYTMFGPYITDFVTNQIISDVSRRYKNMSDEDLDAQMSDIISDIIKNNESNLTSGLYFEDLYDTMTRDQKIALVLIHKDEGAKSAGEYIEMLKPTLIQTKAVNNVQKRLEPFINNKTGELDVDALQKSIEKGETELDENLKTFLIAGHYGIWDGIANFFNGFDYADMGKMDVGDYERMYFAMAMSNCSILGANYTLTSSIGQMAPVVAISYALNFIPGISSTAASLIVGGLNMSSVFGNTLDQSLKNDVELDEALSYAAVTAIISAGSEYMLGGLPGLSKEGESFAIVNILQNAVKEGVQEGFEELLDAGARAVLLNEPIDITELTREELLSFLYGAVTAGFYGTVDLSVKLGSMVYKGKEGYSINDLAKIADYLMKHPDKTVDEAFANYLTPEVMEDMQAKANSSQTGSVVTEEANIDMQASTLATQLDIDEEIAKIMITENCTEEVATKKSLQEKGCNHEMVDALSQDLATILLEKNSGYVSALDQNALINSINTLNPDQIQNLNNLITTITNCEEMPFEIKKINGKKRIIPGTVDAELEIQLKQFFKDLELPETVTVEGIIQAVIDTNPGNDFTLERIKNGIIGNIINSLYGCSLNISNYNSIETLAKDLGLNISLINESGKVNTETLNNYKNKLNNLNVRILYKYNESLIELELANKINEIGMTKNNYLESDLNSMEKIAQYGYNVRNSLRVASQECMIEEISKYLKNGTVAWNNTFEACIINKLFSLNSTKIDNLDLPETQKIKLKNDIETMKENLKNQITESAINTLGLEEDTEYNDIKNQICQELLNENERTITMMEEIYAKIKEDPNYQEYIKISYYLTIQSATQANPFVDAQLGLLGL